MKLTELNVKKALNKAYRLLKPKREQVETFKAGLITLLGQIDEKESEENVKIHLMDFLKNTFYHPDYLIATKGKTDFVIHTGKEAKTPAGVMFEVKKPTNKADMVTRQNLNAKAMHELLLYYLRERLDHKNNNLTHLVITNIYEWFIFDAQDFERLFFKNTQLKKDYEAWQQGQKTSSNTDLFYKEIAKPFLEQLEEEITFTHFNLKDYEKPLLNSSKADDNQLIGLLKILSPVHLLKLPFTNDSNSLDKGFYTELLHLIGLEEIKEGNKKLIRRKPAGKRNEGSLLENVIVNIESEDRLHMLTNPSQYGATEDERLFNVGLELCITWVNRILFLKLLEAQLIKYHRGDKSYKFLNFQKIPQYDELNKLFFQVLAKRPETRSAAIQQKFAEVPYLNSSLFEPTQLEDLILRVNALDDLVDLELYSGTVLRDKKNKPVADKLNALQYLFDFLEAYDFASEGGEEIQEESKTLINASVLGLIFEKINGYRDGSIYTPGFITMYMCRQAIRLAVLQKFKERYGWNVENFGDLENYLQDHRTAKEILEFNALINELHLCDPAVGSGHFLVSALNELIAIKADLGILADKHGKRLHDYKITIENDEMLVNRRDDDSFFAYEILPNGSVDPEKQRVQQTLFHEKQTLIESCLFGVDINPNSVKICRLRLWIELLKNAYYKTEGNTLALETLPNIDINIKQGNSLISRFALDADLGKALKNIKYSVTEYRNFVTGYKNAQDKEEKRKLEDLIAGIKSDFRAEITKNDPKLLKLNKLQGELLVLTTQTSIFEPTAKEKKANKLKQEKLETEIKKLSADVDAIKSNAIYRNAFEWRFEFPEVLDNEGNFEGFDVVIGNPPYGVELSKKEDEVLRTLYKVSNYQIDTYILFGELSFNILKMDGQASLIIPTAWLASIYDNKFREFLLLEANTNSVVICPKNTFEEAVVEPLILNFSKSKNDDSFEVINLSSRESFTIDKNGILNDPNKSFLIFNNSEETKVINKIRNENEKLNDYFDVVWGVKVYEKNKGIPQQSAEDSKSKKFHSKIKSKQTQKPLLGGSEIFSYSINWKGGFLDYGPWLAAPRNPFWFTPSPKILVREITAKGKILAAYSEDEFVFSNSIDGIKLKEDANYSTKLLLAILNSNLASYFHLKSSGNAFKDAFPKILVQDLRDFPIPNATENEQKSITVLVDQILSAKQADPQTDTSALEQQIDQLVYQLYQLTPEEIAIVEGR